MILFLFGPDTYRSRQKIKEVIEEYKKRHQSGLNFIKIDFKERDFSDFKQAVETVSMFDEKKLIVIEEVFQQSEYSQEELLDYLKKRKLSSDKNSIVIFWAEEIKPNSGLFKFLKNKTKVQEFKLLQPYKLKEWIKKYIKGQRADIESQAVEKLVDYIGSDLWRMSNELDKLIVFSKRKIKAQDVEQLIKPKIDIKIFSIIDALGQKHKKQALELVHNYLKKGESEHYLFDRFVYQFRNLIKVKTGGGKELHPFVFKKTQSQATNFSFEDLKKIYRKLLEIDLDRKTGRVELKTALELFIVNL